MASPLIDVPSHGHLLSAGRAAGRGVEHKPFRRHLLPAWSVIRPMTSLIAASPYTRIPSPVLTHSTTALIAPASSFEARTMKVANIEGPSPPWSVTANLLEREVCVPRPRWTSDRPYRGRGEASQEGR